MLTDLITAEEEGNEVDAARGDGWTPLHSAAQSGHLEIVEALVQARADPKAKNRHRNTALHLAAAKGHAAVVTALVQAGADPKAKNRHRNTALHLAAAKGHAAVVTALVLAGAGVDAKNQYGDTALIWVAVRGHAAVVTALVQAGADFNAVDENGHTALICAAHRDYAGTVSEIEKYIESGEYEWRQYLPRLRQAAWNYYNPDKTSITVGIANRVIAAFLKEISFAEKSPVINPCMDFFRTIGEKLDDKPKRINPKIMENFAKIMAALDALEKYKGSRPIVAKEIYDNIIELTELGKIFSSEGVFVGIDEVIQTLSGNNYAEVFNTTWFNRSLTNLQQVISDVSGILGGKSYPDPGSFVKLKEGLDLERESLPVVTQTDSSYSNFFQPAAGAGEKAATVTSAAPEPELQLISLKEWGLCGID